MGRGDSDGDRPGLVRYWFEFALGAAEPLASGGIRLDGGTAAHRFLGRGAGVTGYDEQDCMRLLQAVLDEPLPPLTRSVRDITVEQATAYGFDPHLGGVHRHGEAYGIRRSTALALRCSGA